ncbi:hypothetical protein ACJIZ3_020635 [Penstemon smallii]|uniref:F-box domain-containing protein n=1 Tax=Penstemon smallii TaxID=265156 RepID=A0ABD3SJK8_9LAMI
MSDVIPSELFWEILSRVPAEPLLRFRCVCTEWRQIIDDPAFIRSHLQGQAGRERVMIRTYRGRKLYTFSLEALYNLDKSILAESFRSTLSRHGIPHSKNELFWLDIEKKSAKRVKIRGDLDSFTSQAFPATLVRLNDDKARDGGDENILYKKLGRNINWRTKCNIYHNTWNKVLHL